MTRTPEEQQAPDLVTVRGGAPLPRSLTVSDPGHFEIAVTFDRRSGRIVDVETNQQETEGYQVLRSLLVGHEIGDLDSVIGRLPEHLRGRLLRPAKEALIEVRRVAFMGGRPPRPPATGTPSP